MRCRTHSALQDAPACRAGSLVMHPAREPRLFCFGCFPTAKAGSECFSLRHGAILLDEASPSRTTFDGASSLAGLGCDAGLGEWSTAAAALSTCAGVLRRTPSVALNFRPSFSFRLRSTASSPASRLAGRVDIRPRASGRRNAICPVMVPGCACQRSGGFGLTASSALNTAADKSNLLCLSCFSRRTSCGISPTAQCWPGCRRPLREVSDGARHPPGSPLLSRTRPAGGS